MEDIQFCSDHELLEMMNEYLSVEAPSLDAAIAKTGAVPEERQLIGDDLGAGPHSGGASGVLHLDDAFSVADQASSSSPRDLTDDELGSTMVDHILPVISSASALTDDQGTSQLSESDLLFSDDEYHLHFGDLEKPGLEELADDEAESSAMVPVEPDPKSEQQSTESSASGDHVEQLVRWTWPVISASKSGVGVGHREEYKTWEAHIWLKDRQLDHRPKPGMQLFLGTFASEDEAKQAHDKAAIFLDVRYSISGKPYCLNYPEALYADNIREHTGWSRRDYLWKIRRDSEKLNTDRACSTGLRGVREAKSRTAKATGRFRAATSVTYNSDPTDDKSAKIKVFIPLGSFETKEEAAREYDRAILFIHGAFSTKMTNYRPGGYTEAEIQQIGRRLQKRHHKVNFEKHASNQHWLQPDNDGTAV